MVVIIRRRCCGGGGNGAKLELEGEEDGVVESEEDIVANRFPEAKSIQDRGATLSEWGLVLRIIA